MRRASRPTDWSRPWSEPHETRARVLADRALLATGCITRSVKEPVFEQDLTQVLLRSQVKSGETLPKGFQQPLPISAARMAHILSRIDLRTGSEDAEREPAIPLESLYVIADGMSKAFAKANPDQEVVVMSIRRGKHWGIFDRRYLTSLVAFVKDDLIYIYLARTDWEIPTNLQTRAPRAPRRRAGDDVPAGAVRGHDARDSAGGRRRAGAIRSSSVRRARASCRAARSCGARC